MRSNAFARSDLFGKMICKTTGELEDGLFRNVLAGKRWRTFPADLRCSDTPEFAPRSENCDAATFAIYREIYAAKFLLFTASGVCEKKT